MEFTTAVVNYGTGDLVKCFLDSLAESKARLTRSNLVLREVLVVDSGFPKVSDAARFVQPSKYPWPVRLIPNSGHSYSSGVNKALAVATTDWVVVSNSDVEVIDYTQLEYMVVRASSSDRIAVLCPQLLYPGGEWQRSYGDVPGFLEALKFTFCLDVLETLLRRAQHRHHGRASSVSKKLKTVGYADGAFLLINKPVFRRLGGFDESFRFYAEETDYAERARRAGFRVCYLNVSPVAHARGATVQRREESIGNAEQLYRAKLHFVQKHRGSAYALLYKLMISTGALCRASLFSTIYRLTGSRNWRRRAEDCSRLRAFLESGLQTPSSRGGRKKQGSPAC